jgi:Ca-activated chloride channel homolog
MQGRFLDMVKTTAIKLIRELRKQDILSIVTFSDRADTMVPAGMILDPKSTELKIQMLSTSGGTEIYQGLAKGYSEVIRHRSEKRINHIILITDGRTYGDEKDCIRLAQQAADQGIGISGFGIGNKWNDEFLDELTAISGGNSIFVSKPTEILHFLSEKFINLGQRVAQNVTCDFNLDKGVELRYAYRLQPDAAPLICDSPTVFGSIEDKTSLKVLFEFMVRGLKETVGDKTLLEATISLEVPIKSQSQETYKLIFDRPTSLEYFTENTQPNIVEAMSKLTLYRMQEQARKEIAAGTTLEAAERLQHLATQLLTRGETELAKVVFTEAKNLQQNEHITEEGEKRIKFGTRNLLLPEFVEDQ